MADRRRRSNSLGMSGDISRRDFVNGVLIGSGSALLSARAPGSPKSADASANVPSGSPWTGYGGVGDYRWSNGNTEAVVQAAHGIRDHRYPEVIDSSIHESRDLVIVGGGFSGLTAAYEFMKNRKDGQSCLLLDNHPVLGGEAKQNEFEVNGHALVAPQGSNTGLVINKSYVKGSYGAGRYDAYADYWRELQLPEHFDLEPLAGGAEKYLLANDHFDPMYTERRYATGYFFPGHGWVANPIEARFRNSPWDAATQKELDDFVNNRRDVISNVTDVDRWLDSISYYQLLDKLGYGSEVKRYVDPVIAVGNFGVCGDAISAYAAKRLTLPGTIPSHEKNRFVDTEVVSFPGGNTAIFRTMLAKTLPGALTGDGSLADAALGHFNPAALDQPGHPLQMRTGSTVIRVQHPGKPSESGTVIVTYARNGKLYNVEAKAVILGSGGWINRNIVKDLSQPHADAYRQFKHAPVLVANVAVTNWRFFDKLGFVVARSFNSLGWHVSVRQNVMLRKTAAPLTPDSPMVLTFYIPFLHPGTDPSVQGSLGRGRLFATSYAQFEQQLREQLTEMFASSGFEAKRDIAAIVLNRWGHAYFTPPFQFFYSQPGAPSIQETLHQPHGRVYFAHSELQGNMNMAHAMLEGRRAALEALKRL